MISACLVVKDEELLLPDCLETLDWVDEIVVVDTGSTDKTKAIATAYGATIYEQPWTGDFSYHRNYAFDQAQGDWCFVLDADERVVAKPKPETEELLNESGWAGASVTMQDCLRTGVKKEQWLSLRFFKADANPRYVHAVHNTPQVDGKRGMTNILVYHFGYDGNPETKARKFEIRREGLLKALEDDPENQRAMFYLAHTMYGHEQYEATLRWGDKCVTTKRETVFDSIYVQMGRAAEQLRFPSMAEAYYHMALQRNPDDIDATWFLAFLLLRQGVDTDLVERYARLRKEYARNPKHMEGRFVFTNSSAHEELLYELRAQEAPDANTTEKE